MEREKLEDKKIQIWRSVLQYKSCRQEVETFVIIN